MNTNVNINASPSVIFQWAFAIGAGLVAGAASMFGLMSLSARLLRAVGLLP